MERRTYFFRADVAGGQDVLHLVGQQKFFELLGDVAGPSRNVNVANDESELIKILGQDRWMAGWIDGMKCEVWVSYFAKLIY
jgi:hypothetical protein